MTDQAMQATSLLSADARDRQAKADATPTAGFGDHLAFAAKRSGLSPVKLARDFMRHARSGRGIEIEDYVRHQLWDEELHPNGSADLFVGARTIWPAAHSVNDRAWWCAMEDKFVMTAMLSAEGLPQPDTLAVIDTRSARRYPGVERLSTAGALREFVLSQPQGSLFAKTLGGMIGQGAMVIEAADEHTITGSGFDPVSYESFLADVLENRTYILQRRLESHPDLTPYCSGVATIRLPAFIREGEVLAPMASLKVPYGDNIACAFWRPDNIAGGIDPGTGEITRVAGHDGPMTVDLPDHPARPGLKGLRLPYWKDVRDIYERAVRLFGDVPYQSTDIALTPEGPALVEINYAGSFDILQNGTGMGLLQPEVRSFFADHGVTWTARKRRGLMQLAAGR